MTYKRGEKKRMDHIKGVGVKGEREAAPYVHFRKKFNAGKKKRRRLTRFRKTLQAEVPARDDHVRKTSCDI